MKKEEEKKTIYTKENNTKKQRRKNYNVPYLINEVLQLDSGIVFPLSGF